MSRIMYSVKITLKDFEKDYDSFKHLIPEKYQKDNFSKTFTYNKALIISEICFCLQSHKYPQWMGDNETQKTVIINHNNTNFSLVQYKIDKNAKEKKKNLMEIDIIAQYCNLFGGFRKWLLMI